jgi:hypothetical protein
VAQHEVLIDGVRYVPESDIVEPPYQPDIDEFWFGECIRDGRWFPVCWADAAPPQNALGDQDILDAAARYDVPAAHIDAVRQVEAGASGFLLSEPHPARPKVLFERHWFYKLTPVKVSAVRPDLSNPSPGGYKGGAAEWDRLKDAAQFDLPNALKSASWGLGQVMGFNFKVAGCASIEDYVVEAFTGESAQFGHMLHFIANNSLMDELRRGDWRGFAKGYNGPAYEQNDYHKKLARAAANSKFA